MKVWIVFVKASWAGTLVGRYIDSQWAEGASAESRRTELENMFKAFRCQSTDSGMGCYVVEGSITDCKIVEAAGAP